MSSESASAAAAKKPPAPPKKRVSLKSKLGSLSSPAAQASVDGSVFPVAVAIGDLHFDAAYADDCRNLSRELVKIVRSVTDRRGGRRPYVVVLGDTLHHHEKVFTESMTDAVSLFKELRDAAEHLYILVGNHDMPTGHDYLRERHWMHAIKGEWARTTVVDRPISETWGHGEKAVKVVLAPYVPAGMLDQSLDECKVSPAGARAVFCHQEFKNAHYGAALSTIGDDWPEDAPMVVSGHIHKNQTVGDNVYYVGSSMQLAFGDSSKTVVAELDFSVSVSGTDAESKEPSSRPRPPSLTEIELTSVRKKRSVSVAGISGTEAEVGAATASAVAHARGGDAVRVSVTGTPEEFKKFTKTDAFRDLTKAGAVVTLKRPRTRASNVQPTSGGEGEGEGDDDDTLTRSFFLAELKRIVEEKGDPRVHSIQREVFSKLEIRM